MNQEIITTNNSVKEFTRQLIADRCRTLIENENMLPPTIMDLLKKAYSGYILTPDDKNFYILKEYIFQINYIEESIQYKDFYRSLITASFYLGMTKMKSWLPKHSSMLDSAISKLRTINVKLKSSPHALMQHYSECLNEMQSNHFYADHYTVAFIKEIFIKLFYETICDFLTNSTSSIENIDSAPNINPVTKREILNSIIKNNVTNKKCYNVILPLFTL